MGRPPLPQGLPPLSVAGGVGSPIRARPDGLPRASPGLVLWQLLRWSWGGLRLAARIGWDQARGVGTPKSMGLHASAVAASMGGTTPIVARQIALRLDLLPMEVCLELTRLPDVGEAIPAELVAARVEAATGRPLDETFARFDPEPISAETVSLVYQAELRSGERVAVRIRRPGVGESLAADAAALGFLLTLFGPLAGRRARLLTHLRGELRTMILDDIDLVKVGRRQRLFRKLARDAGVRWVTAARIHRDLSRDDVLVSEFVSGVRLSEVIGAVRRGDPASKAWLTEQNIDPTRLGKRVMALGLWDIFENVFFDEAPEPHQVVVKPGGRLVLLNFMDSGRISRTRRLQLRGALEDLSQQDVEGCVQSFFALLAPLPPVDLHELSRFAERRVWTAMFAMENRDLPWSERTSAPLWMALMDACYSHGVPVPLELCRLMRAAILWDALSAQLWPGMRFLQGFRRYLRRSAHRIAVSERRRSRKGMSRASRDTVLSRAPALVRSVRRASGMVQAAADEVPLATMTAVSKASYAASVLVTAATRILWATGAAVLVLQLMAWRQGGLLSPGELGDALARSLAWLSALLLIAVLAMREIVFRLDDLDPDD